MLSGLFFRYAIVTNEGKHEKRIALLSESDDVYVKYRHVHVLVVLKKIPEDIKRFLNANAAAKLSKRKVRTRIRGVQTAYAGVVCLGYVTRRNAASNS